MNIRRLVSGKIRAWVFVVLIVGPLLVSVASVSADEGTLFEDDFGELNLNNWSPFGSPSPRVLASVEGRTGVFDNNGDSWCDSGAVSKDTFPLSNGFTMGSDVFVRVTNMAGCWDAVVIGLTKENTPYWDHPNCPGEGYYTGLAFGIVYVGDACWAAPSEKRRHAYFRISLYNEDGVGEGPGGYEKNADDYLNGWHNLKIVVGEDRFVSFYCDDTFIYKSTKRIHEDILQDKKIYLGQRSCGGSAGKAYHDNIKVYAGGSDDGLVAEWHFDEGSGTIATDSSGNGNDGTIHGATWTTGVSGTALEFDGVEDYVEVPHDPSISLSGTDNFAFAAWFKTDSDSEYEVIINKNPATVAYDPGYRMSVSSGYLDLMLEDSSHGPHWKGTTIVNDGKWHYGAMVINWSADEAYIYVDGKLDGTADISGIGDISNTANLGIGTRIGKVYAGCFNGIIDEVAIFNRALTESEIRELYGGGIEEHCYSDGIVALVKFIGWAGSLSAYMNDQEKTVPVMQEQVEKAMLDILLHEIGTPFSTMSEVAVNYPKTKKFIENAPKLELSWQETACITSILQNAKYKHDYITITRDGEHVYVKSTYFETVIDQPNVVFDRITIDGTKDPLIVEVIIDGVTLQVKGEVYPGFIDLYQDVQHKGIEFDLNGYHYTSEIHYLRIGACGNLLPNNLYFSLNSTFYAPFLDLLGIKNHITSSIDSPTYYKKSAIMGGVATGLSASAHPGVGGSGSIKLAIYEKVPFPVFLENADEIQKKLEKRKLEAKEGESIQEITHNYISECLQNSLASQDNMVGIALTESLGAGVGGEVSGIGVYLDIIAGEGSVMETPLYTFLNEDDYNKCLTVFGSFVGCKAALTQSGGNLLSPLFLITYANLINSINQVPQEVQKDTLLKSYGQLGLKFGGGLIVGGSASSAGRLEERRNLVLLPTEDFYLNFRSRLVGKLSGGLYMPLTPIIKFPAEIFLGASMPCFLDIEDPFDQTTVSSNNMIFSYLESNVSDRDGDGLFDYLNVSYRMQTNISGDYIVVGTLSQNKSVIVTELLNTTLYPGNNTVLISFTGFRLRYAGVDGPYEVGCMVFDENLTLVATNFSLGVTDAYNHLYFEAPTANITRVNVSAVDEDYDGLYDYMDCNITIYSEENQSIYVDSVFGTSESTYYGALVGADLHEGLNNVVVRVNSTVLRTLCGNISVLLTCLDENNYTLSEFYNSTQYYSKLFSTQKPFLEYYINTTLIDGTPAIVLKVNSSSAKNLTITTYYWVENSSYASAGFYNVSPGTSEVVLPLDSALLLFGTDLECNVTTAKLYSETGLVDCLKNLGLVEYTIVPKATILYEGDSVVDLDQDGKFDVLSINLTVNSTEDDNILLVSSLTGNGTVPKLFFLSIDANSSQNIVIEFEGALISEIGEYNGNFTYRGSLYENGSLWASIHNLTGCYNTSDFSDYPINRLPNVNFRYTPEYPVISQMVTFNASLSYDPDGYIVNYTWNFGDGNITNTTEAIITHSYASAGDYTVNLAVADNDGAVNTTTRLVNVSLIKFNISLTTDWNLISVPRNLTTWQLGEESIVGTPLNVTPKNSRTSIYRYNSSTGTFDKCDYFDDWGWWPATGSESFTELEPSKGYWVWAKTDCNLTFTGTVPSDINVTLDTDWNLIGWYSLEAALLGQESVVGNPLNVTPLNSLTSVYRYNSSTGLFDKCDHLNDWGWWPATGSESFTELEPCRGYWVWAENGCVWRHKV